MVAFYDLSAKKPNGEQVAFEDLKGKVVLVVNTGVQCIFTPQRTYKEQTFQRKKLSLTQLAPTVADLQQLHEKYHEKGLVVLGCTYNLPYQGKKLITVCAVLVPSGQFPKEASADDAAIGAFCQKNYGVTFVRLAGKRLQIHSWLSFDENDRTSWQRAT